MTNNEEVRNLSAQYARLTLQKGAQEEARSLGASLIAARTAATGMTFAEAFKKFHVALQAKMDAKEDAAAAHRASLYPNLKLTFHRREYALDGDLDYLLASPKARYARIAERLPDTPPGRFESVYCFVDLWSGDILKPNTFKSPAKHARGNIFDPDPLKFCGEHGIATLR